MKMVNQFFVFSFILIMISFPVWGEENIKTEAASPTLPSHTFSSESSLVWEAIISVLNNNDITVQSSDKDKGKISTGTKRYFRILSANFPPVQKDYRDTYVILVNKKDGKSTHIEIERKFEIFDEKSNAWVLGDPKKEMEGLDEGTFFKEVQMQLAANSQ